MKLQISTDGVPLSGTQVEKLLEQHLLSDLIKYFERFDSEDLVADVRVVKRSRWGYKVTYDLKLSDKHIYAEEKDDLLPLAITKTRDEVKRQIRKFKEKKIDLSRQSMEKS